MHKQRGVTLLALIVICFILIFVALLGMKLAPAYIEYFAVKKAVTGMMADLRNPSVGEVRAAFNRRAQIDSIEIISGNDLEIGKDGNDLTVSFAYPKKIALFSNISVLIEFSGGTGK